MGLWTAPCWWARMRSHECSGWLRPLRRLLRTFGSPWKFTCFSVLIEEGDIWNAPLVICMSSVLLPMILRISGCSVGYPALVPVDAGIARHSQIVGTVYANLNWWLYEVAMLIDEFSHHYSRLWYPRRLRVGAEARSRMVPFTIVCLTAPQCW